jgi:His/Glu/Gln/Arg/opine family amino acid ABC transporter permease subunit
MLSLILSGLGLTLEVSFVSLLFASAIGFVCGAARASSVVWLRAIVAVYVGVVRSIPLLILLFLVFYGLPIFAGIDSASPFQVTVITMSVYLGAYMTQVVWAGLKAVPRGQWSAARALGLGYVRAMRHVIIPQAMRVIAPAGVGILVAGIKDSSLASVIGLFEVTRTSMAVRNITLSNWDVLGLLAFLYFVVTTTISLLGTAVERWQSVDGRRSARLQSVLESVGLPQQLDSV